MTILAAYFVTWHMQHADRTHLMLDDRCCSLHCVTWPRQDTVKRVPRSMTIFCSSDFVAHAGCQDKAIRVWSTQSGREVTAWRGHVGIPTALKWAPQKVLVASACAALGLWLPDFGKLGMAANIPAPAQTMR